MIDQVRIGNFLRILRKEKGKTQEQLAETFGVSSRSVSRWENGNTLPDLGLLVELADYYGVDVREIIDGERKCSQVEKEEKETLLKVADYAGQEKKQALRRRTGLIIVCCVIYAVLNIGIVGLVIWAFSQQYNSRGVSSLLCIYIDPEEPKEYIGELDGYRIYTDQMRSEECYYTTFREGNVSLADAVDRRIVSVADWRRKAWITVSVRNGEILRYENYEILVMEDECVIRPIRGYLESKRP